MREWLGAVLLVLCGCGGLHVNLVDSARRPPSTVALYLSVDTEEGAPVTGLSTKDFEIYEDGSLRDTGQALLDPAPFAAHHTLLLIDMSTSESRRSELHLLSGATRSFLSTLSGSQKVAVYAFDGSPALQRIQGFSSTPNIERTIKKLESFKVKNPAINLDNAVLEAKRLLVESLGQAKQPLRFGTLVVFTDGLQSGAHGATTQRGRTSATIGASVFAVGEGRSVDDATLSRIGVNGYAHVADKGALPRVFRSIAERIAASTRSYYLLSYCSNGRPGSHQVGIRVIDPRTRAKGDVRHSFNDRDFRPKCNPGAVPRFTKWSVEHGTVRGGGDGVRGAPLVIQGGPADLDPASDPELGASSVSAPSSAPPSDTAAPVDPAAPALDMEALENEVPPGLQHKDDEDEDEDEDD